MSNSAPASRPAGGGRLAQFKVTIPNDKNSNNFRITYFALLDFIINNR